MISKKVFEGRVLLRVLSSEKDLLSLLSLLVSLALSISPQSLSPPLRAELPGPEKLVLSYRPLKDYPKPARHFTLGFPNYSFFKDSQDAFHQLFQPLGTFHLSLIKSS